VKKYIPSIFYQIIFKNGKNSGVGIQTHNLKPVGLQTRYQIFKDGNIAIHIF